MCISAKVRFVGTTSAAFVNDTVYDVLGFASNTNVQAVAIVLGDDGKLHATHDLAGANWELVSLTAPGAVV